MSLKESPHDDVHLTADDAEQQILLRLEQEFQQEQAAHKAAQAEYDKQYEVQKRLLAAYEAAGDNAEGHVGLGETPLLEPPPKFQPTSLARTIDNEYQYYQVVHWQQNCGVCHISIESPNVLSAADPAAPLQDVFPFIAMKVVIPSKDVQDAVNYNRSMLLAIALGTVVLSVAALWVIVRYVIAKPLNHLRYVSDEISRGNTSLRAEINTNDEFEDLAVSFNRMIRHLTEAQDELRDANTSLDGKVDELAQMNMQLYEMNQIKSDFLANMSHELRTPLNSIIGFSDVLKGIDALNPKQKRYAENIQKSGRVLLEMINDILDLAKMEAGKMGVRPSEFRIEAIVSAHCDMIRSLSEEKNIDLDVDTADDLPPLFQDQSKVQQILTNLLSNAIKFTPEGGRIVVSVRKNKAGQLELAVADTGVGIAEEDRETIFEKFRQGLSLQQGDNLTREYSGTGLGLSIIKELCKLLGGEVSLTSVLGQGSRFLVTLPWRAEEISHSDSNLAHKLDDLTKLRRLDPARLSNTSAATSSKSNENGETEVVEIRRSGVS